VISLTITSPNCLCAVE